jgi:pimeloyl-ACP methyl ester carboxylesterase
MWTSALALLTHVLQNELTIVLILLVGLGSVTVRPVLAADLRDSPGFASVVLEANLHDRSGKPIAGIPLNFTGTLDGLTLRPGGVSYSYRQAFVQTAVTDSGGRAVTRVLGPAGAGAGETPWFRGRVSASVHVAPKSREISLVKVSPEYSDFTLPASPMFGNPTGESTLRFAFTAFEEANARIGGFPVWTANDGTTDRIVVLLEGFDIYNDYSASDVMRLVSVAGDILRQRGIAFLVVNYPNSLEPPDKLAPTAATAVQAAAAASGRKVTLAGLSMGGLVARWALVEAENNGKPLPVHTLLQLDTPNRGANINPGLQAMTERYGTESDRLGMQSEAAGALLFARPAQVEWRSLGLPGANRLIPVYWVDDTSAHDSFYNRLRALNDNRGYPKTIRRVAVANSSRSRKVTVPREQDLLNLWLPFSFSWMLRAHEIDHAPGSLLPPQYAKRFAVEYPFGIAGSELGFVPTFIPTSSALDAEANDKPPFDAFYARPDNQPNRAHDDIDPGAAAFVAREILNQPW